jgi:hypothetical protein
MDKKRKNNNAMKNNFNMYITAFPGLNTNIDNSALL